MWFFMEFLLMEHLGLKLKKVNSFQSKHSASFECFKHKREKKKTCKKSRKNRPEPFAQVVY